MMYPAYVCDPAQQCLYAQIFHLHRLGTVESDLGYFGHTRTRTLWASSTGAFPLLRKIFACAVVVAVRRVFLGAFYPALLTPDSGATSSR